MNWLQIVLSLIGVLGLIFMLFYALKKLNRRVSVQSGNKMRILDRVNLGRDGMLIVVSVCGKLMLMGVTAQRVEKICDLDVAEGEYFPPAPEGQQDFKSILATAFGKKQKNTDENENRYSHEDDKND